MRNQNEQIKGSDQCSQQPPLNRPGLQKLLFAVTAAGILAVLTGCSTTSDRTAGRVVDDKAVTSRVKHALAHEPVYKHDDVNVSTYNGTVQLSGWARTEGQREQAGQIASRTEGVYEVINNISLKNGPTGREGYSNRFETNNVGYRRERTDATYRSERDRDYGTARREPNSDLDHTRQNVRDRSDAPLTASDQGHSAADREITQKIRKTLVNDSNGYSTTAQNIKIITVNGKVTLRGAVKTEAERSGIVTIAKNVAGDANVDDQLEVKPNP